MSAVTVRDRVALDPELVELWDIADHVDALLAGELDRPARRHVTALLDEHAQLLLAERLIDPATLGRCIHLAWELADLGGMTEALEIVGADDVLAELLRHDIPIPVSSGRRAWLLDREECR